MFKRSSLRAGITAVVLIAGIGLFISLGVLRSVPEARAATRTVNNSSELQTALNQAVAGDEIVLNNGTY
jgi:hypothetical protein